MLTHLAPSPRLSPRGTEEGLSQLVPSGHPLTLRIPSPLLGTEAFLGSYEIPIVTES